MARPSKFGSNRHASRWTWLVVATVLLFGYGCADEPQSQRMGRRTVAISDVPENILSAAKKTLPDVDFNDAWKNLDRDGNLHSYEIRGRNSSGKIRECRVSRTGEILETE